MINQDVMQNALRTSNELSNEGPTNAGEIALDNGIMRANPEAKDMANANKAIMMMVQAEQKGKEPTMMKFAEGMGDYETSAKQQRALQQMLTKLS